MSTPAAITVATAALVAAPLDTAATLCVAAALTKTVAAATQRVSALLADAESIGDPGSPYLHSIYDRVDAVSSAAAAARAAVVARLAEVSAIADAAAENRDQVISFAGAHAPETCAEAWASAQAWIEAAAVLRDAEVTLRSL